jgi:hypothetical protein
MVLSVFGFHIFFASADPSPTLSDHQNSIGKNHRGFRVRWPAGGCQKRPFEKKSQKGARQRRKYDMVQRGRRGAKQGILSGRETLNHELFQRNKL